jgi:Arc/MetJ family transcription regulator
MRTNIDIDDAVLDAAMKAGPYKTKKDAVEAGLKLLARQAHYREVLRWEGKLQWDGDTEGQDSATAPLAGQPAVVLSTGSAVASTALQAHETNRKRRDAGR